MEKTKTAGLQQGSVFLEHVADVTGDETILVAEDDAGVRGFMSDVLTLHGYKVMTANDGQDAIEKFRQSYPFDLIILDMVMPGKNGWETYEEIRKIDPNVKVLFTSGYTKDIVLGKGLEEKEFDFIPKPLALEDMLEKVRKALDTR